MHYLALLESSSPTSREQFVARSDPEIRGELDPFLEEILAAGPPVDRPAGSVDDQPLIDRAAARFRERLAGPFAAATVVDLHAARRSRRLGIASLAQQLNLPVDLLSRIEHRGVLPATIPDRLVARLASIFGHPETEVRTWLAAPQAVSGAPQIRETARPYLPSEPAEAVPDAVLSQGVMSFVDALVASSATAEQREEWAASDDLRGRGGPML